MEYSPVELLRFPSASKSSNAEQRWWKRLRPAHSEKHFAKVTDIDFSCVSNAFAVTSSARITIYDASSTGQISESKVLSRLKGVAFSGRFREDGNLVVSGGAEKRVRVFDPSSRSVVREFEGHLDEVHATSFCGIPLVVSGSDDSTVRVWDVPTDKALVCFRDHRDRVRSISVSSDKNWFISGSYDHTVKLWDIKREHCSSSFGHEGPVQSIKTLSDGSGFISAADNMIYIWDKRNTCEPLHKFSNHQKQITNVCIDGSGSRLVSSSLDQSVKFYDMKTLKVTHTMNYTQPVLCAGLSKDNSVLAVGMVDGTLDVKTRQIKAEQDDIPLPVVDEEDLVDMNALRQQKRVRAVHDLPVQDVSNPKALDEVVAKRSRKPKLRLYDTMLKAFRYQDALDSVLITEAGKYPQAIVVALFEELIQRGGLEAAISKREPHTLVPILFFVRKNITNPHFSRTLLLVFHSLLYVYEESLVTYGDDVHNEFQRLYLLVNRFVEEQKEMKRFLGEMNLIIGSIELAHS